MKKADLRRIVQLKAEIGNPPPEHPIPVSLAWLEIDGSLHIEVRWYKTHEAAAADVKNVANHAFEMGACGFMKENL